MNSCPCGSGIDYAACCEPIITGKTLAETAEQLMRARYSAHVVVDVDFIYESTHPDFREGYDHKGTKIWAEKSEWLGLEILTTEAGGAEDQKGEVEFVARFRNDDGTRTHHERGHFLRKGKEWLFSEGEMVKPRPISVTKIGRNDPCSCGSGKKYKKCCGQ
ncbi:SEC-C motif-containing protein [Desulfuromusa kysingii]|uniref:SEC-C motif-containing protein n=1 Tax=Desulfuromusa kysingii TaxID=37625 RepID=A0A1H3X668_9BACT|nr:YchJ family protein [Desulfuromusa kysingii]SDZ94750.1 SEC-C motif-containing protein [Desulfuromusa kysingii]